MSMGNTDRVIATTTNQPAGEPSPTTLPAANTMSTLNALSIDVEEHFHVHVFSKWIKQTDWVHHGSRVANNTQRLLALLRRHNTHATFFVLGWVAERQPDLIQEIVDDGHEIASHGYKHELVYEQTPAEFSEDIERSLDVISKAAPSATVKGYRAPSFSITMETAWAQDILLKYGFQYDSSIFPVAMHDRYGIPDANRFAHQLPNGLWEFPMSTVRLAGRNLPVAGGGYFRLYPLWMTNKAIKTINTEGCPAIVYIHPWEVDPEQPRIDHATRPARFRHYANIGKVEERLDKLLTRYSFGPLSQVFAAELSLFDAEQVAMRRYSSIDSESIDTHHAYRNRNSGGTVLSTSSSGHVVP